MSALQFNVNLISANMSVINSFTMEVPIIIETSPLIRNAMDWFLHDSDIRCERVKSERKSRRLRTYGF